MFDKTDDGQQQQQQKKTLPAVAKNGRHEQQFDDTSFQPQNNWRFRRLHKQKKGKAEQHTKCSQSAGLANMQRRIDMHSQRK